MSIQTGEIHTAPVVYSKVYRELIDGRWYAFCHTHSNCREYPRGIVDIYMCMPWEWCPQCHQLLHQAAATRVAEGRSDLAQGALGPA